ncbi:hypothetical protein IWQ60_000138 [Tieghemiomyces parasiticus]|uniref:Uncharacterized protein n=1 Tax=Tieghemiomyces parasiticus TaxID=78921 RepID=A0A9W8AJH2_9FUNG|nr:hypothetical protein IWQ60_000138 [Tieghemiomyces parasiticus]
MLVHAGDVIRHSGNTPDAADEQAKARDGLTQELERFDDMCDSILIALKTLKHQVGAATQDSPVTTTAVPVSMTPTVSDTEPSVRSGADDWRRAQLDELRRLVLDPLA